MTKFRGFVIGVGVFFFAALGISVASPQKQQQTKYNDATTINANADIAPTPPEQICDGTSIKGDCVYEGVRYKTYVFHPAVAEKSHTEQTTTYERKITDYCTLCQDGTYSPSCATGRGACSHHGGVAEWNAPRYSNVPVYGTKTVVDSPAQEAFYEKAVE